MRILKVRGFTRWATGEGIPDAMLMAAAQEIARGQVEASLGGYLFKKRIAKDGGGKSGGYRMIVCFTKQGDENLYFMHGFDKGDVGNITPKQSKALREIARHYASLTNEQIDALVSSCKLFEIAEVSP